MNHLLIASGVLGPCLAVWGIVLAVAPNRVKKMVTEMRKSATLTILFGFFMFVSGLLLVRLHNDFSTTHAAVTSIFSWILVLKGVTYLLVPELMEWKFIDVMLKKIPAGVFAVMGLIICGLGIYILYPAYF